MIRHVEADNEIRRNSERSGSTRTTRYFKAFKGDVEEEFAVYVVRKI